MSAELLNRCGGAFCGDYVDLKAGYARIRLLAEWIERDRREPDKVLAYAQELANLATAHGGP